MLLKSKKEFLSLILVIFALVLTIIFTGLNLFINNQSTFIATAISTVIFMYGMVTYSMEKMKIKSDKL